MPASPVHFALRALYAFGKLRQRTQPQPTDVPAVRTGDPAADRILLVGNGPSHGWGVLTHQLALTGQLADAVASRTGRACDADLIGAEAMNVRSALAWIGDRDLATWTPSSSWSAPTTPCVSLPWRPGRASSPTARRDRAAAEPVVRRHPRRHPADRRLRREGGADRHASPSTIAAGSTPPPGASPRSGRVAYLDLPRRRSRGRRKPQRRLPRFRQSASPTRSRLGSSRPARKP